MDAQTWMGQYEYVAKAVAQSKGMPHVAVCFACTPLEEGPLPYAWANDALRDEWAGEHARLNRHRVERYDVDRAGVPQSLPAALPPRPRPGETPSCPRVAQ